MSRDTHAIIEELRSMGFVAPVEGEVLTWANNRPHWVAPVGGSSDHGALTGLADDDHTQYQTRSEKDAVSGYCGLDASGLVPDARIPAGIARDSEVSAAVAAHEAASDPHPGYQRESEKAAANGYASLDSSTLVPRAQLGSGTPSSSVFLRGDAAWATPAGGSGSGQLELCFYADANVNLTLTNQANAEQFLGNSDRNIKKADLASYTQVRLLARVVTASASVNSPRLYVEYATSFTTTVGSYLAIGASAVNCSLAAVGLIDSGWINLVAGAKADVFVTVLQNGGNAAADPALGPIAVQFK